MVLHNWLCAFMHASFSPHKSPFYKWGWGSDSFGNLLNIMQLLCSRVWNLNHKFFVTKFYFPLLSAASLMKWQPTPVLLPGKSYGWRSLFGYRPQGRKESDTIKRLHFTLFHFILLSRLRTFLAWHNTSYKKLLWRAADRRGLTQQHLLSAALHRSFL